uniref:CSON006395 protein n=1 Tax=Culicoides sonorensis TaxID=179676 RepID=A0A336MXH3_CULSO
MIKHRFQLISIIIFSLLLFQVILIAHVRADGDANNKNNNAELQNNENSVDERNENDNNNRSDAIHTAPSDTNGTTLEKNDKLPSKSVNEVERPSSKSTNVTENDNNIDNKSDLKWDKPLFEPNINPNPDDTYDSLYSKPFTQLYDIGVQAYLENNWNECIVFLEIAVHEFKVYKQGIVNCRLQCKYENDREEPFYDTPTTGELQFFDLMLKRTVCLSKCYRTALKQQYLPPFYLSQYYFERFLNMRPYEYLQLCYYRDMEYEKAASATYTVLMHNIDNSLQMSNMQYYIKEQKVDISKVKDLEEQPFVQQFIDGMDAYHNNEYEVTIHLLEESLLGYLMAQDECRAFCDGEFDHGGWQPDFFSAIGNHFIYSLYCKQNCTRDLNNFRGESYENLLSIHYEYLQFAYFKINDIKRACRAVASFLLFHPNDEEMLYNLNYYKEEHKAPDNYFKPRNVSILHSI